MGYDALLVVASKKIKGKMRRLKKAAVLEYTYNRYVQIPAGAGSDNNPVLSEVNAAFFNELYRTEINPRINIDFTGKKLAIFETHCSASKMEQKTIAEYVERVKKLVAVYGYASTEVTCILNEKQKEESGGYDIIIQYKCKMNLPVERVIDELKKNRQ